MTPVGPCENRTRHRLSVALKSACTVFLIAAGLHQLPLHAAATDCTKAPADSVLLSDKLQYRVVGTGRLYFHAAPQPACVDKKTFVVPGDELVAYEEAGEDGEWSEVTFMTKAGKDVSGWVRSDRLMFLGAFGLNMTPEKSRYYQEKAAKVARAHKGVSP